MGILFYTPSWRYSSTILPRTFQHRLFCGLCAIWTFSIPSGGLTLSICTLLCLRRAPFCLLASYCLNLFALFSFMAFRAFGCPFAAVNKIPIQRGGFSFRRRLFGLMAFRRRRRLSACAIFTTCARAFFTCYLFSAAARSAARAARFAAFLLFFSDFSAVAAVRSAQAAARSCFSAALMA